MQFWLSTKNSLLSKRTLCRTNNMNLNKIQQLFNKMWKSQNKNNYIHQLWTTATCHSQFFIHLFELKQRDRCPFRILMSFRPFKQILDLLIRPRMVFSCFSSIKTNFKLQIVKKRSTPQVRKVIVNVTMEPTSRKGSLMKTTTPLKMKTTVMRFKVKQLKTYRFSRIC